MDKNQDTTPKLDITNERPLEELIYDADLGRKINQDTLDQNSYNKQIYFGSGFIAGMVFGGTVLLSSMFATNYYISKHNSNHSTQLETPTISANMEKGYCGDKIVQPGENIANCPIDFGK